MLKRIALSFAGLALCAPALAGAQQSGSGATITGVVRDAEQRPMAGADVVARPGGHRTTTDSVGRFTLSDLDADTYRVSARKLGFAPEEWTVALSKSGHVEVELVLKDPMPLLDTVTVKADAECPLVTLQGFVCRRRGGGGLFMDYNEIDDHDVTYVADLFRDLEGFRETMRSTRDRGLVRVVETASRSGCIASLVDGHEAGGAYRLPEYPYELVAIEIYARPDSVPKQLQRYTWPQRAFSRAGRCSVVLYWTERARLK